MSSIARLLLLWYSWYFLLWISCGNRSFAVGNNEQQQACSNENNGGACINTDFANEQQLQKAEDDGVDDGGDNNDDHDEDEYSEGQENDCDDVHQHCDYWAGIGECTKNPPYMNQNCRRSCRLCPDQTFSQDEKEIGLDLGVAQLLDGNSHATTEDIKVTLQKAREYMEQVVPEKYGFSLVDACKNELEKCAYYATIGKCESEREFYKQKCAPVCNSCEMKTIEGRCPIDPNAPNAWGPGDLNKLFEKLTSEPYLSQYSVTILSRPSSNATTNNDNDDNDTDDDDDVVDGPWVITMENVLSDAEAERIIELGHSEGYVRSTGVGKLNADGSHTTTTLGTRTSTNAWCNNKCAKDEVAIAVNQRLSDLVGIPEQNSEYLQLLRYEPGQWYDTHHDYIAHQRQRQQGVRLLTVFLYLNDVEEGGGTSFPLYNITVEPKRGRALIWPSVLDHDPNEKDPRTEHQATHVIKGVKYGANAWYHIRDFKTPHALRCQ